MNPKPEHILQFLTDENIYRNVKTRNINSSNWKINFVSIENSIKVKDENMLSLSNINEPSDLQKIKKYF